MGPVPGVQAIRLTFPGRQFRLTAPPLWTNATGCKAVDLEDKWPSRELVGENHIMRWREGRRSENVEDRRSMSPRRMAVGGGIGGVAAIVFALE